MKWKVVFDTEKKEVDTGNNDVNGERKKFNSLGVVKFHLEAEGVPPLTVSVRITDADSIIVLSKKFTAIGKRLEYFARKASRKGYQPFAKEASGTPLGDAIKDMVEIIHE